MGPISFFERERLIDRDTQWLIAATIVSLIGFFVTIRTNRINRELNEQIDRALNSRPQIAITVPIPEKLPEQKPAKSIVRGTASYYSREGCVGCSPDLIMANGEPLDDTKQTVSYNWAPLNSFVTIKNVKTGAIVTAKVTDRGGYEKYGRVIDLTIATRDAIGCGSTCDVEVTQ